MNATLKNALQNAPENFIYIYIPDNIVHEFQGYPIILQKRTNAIYFMRYYTSSENEYEEAKNMVGAAFKASYNMDPGQALYYICSGQSHLVRSKTSVTKVAGIGVVVELNSMGAPVNSKIETDGADVCTDFNGQTFRAVIDTQTGQATHWMNDANGEILSSYNTKTKQWEFGKGNVATNDVWSKTMGTADNVMTFIQKIKEIWQTIVDFFKGQKKPEKPGDLGARQQDSPNRFVGDQLKNPNTIFMLLGGIAVLGLGMALLSPGDKPQKASN